MESEIRESGVVLRLWCDADEGTVESIVTSSRSELDIWLPGLVSDLSDFDSFVARVVRSADDGTGWYYAIEASGRVVGQCSLEVKEGGTAEIGYWIRTNRCNEGIATRAVRALSTAAAAHGFETLLIHCDEANVGSAAVAQKLGFIHLSTVDLDPTMPRTGVQAGREMTWRLAL